MNYDDLLPCPFCGSANLRYEFAGSQGYICCDNCGTQGPCDEQAADPICDYDAAYAAWNRRAAWAESDGPAVSDDREPASVATQLTEPEAEGPTDEEIISQADKFLAYSDAHMGDPARWEGSDVDLVAFTRHALARWGHPAAAPVPVSERLPDEELDDWHSRCADLTRLGEAEHYWAFDLQGDDVAAVARAAIARWGRPAAAPVPVSERLPEPEDCDAEGRCWLGGRQMGSGTRTWLLGYPAWAERFPDVHRFWLPANALPLPAGEETK